MTRDNRGPGSPSRRRQWAFRPSNEDLEDRLLLATAAIDVTTTQVANSAKTPPGPLGVEMVGAASNTTAGYTVTDVGNVTGSGFDSYVVSAPSLAATPVGSNPVIGSAPSVAYLIFGSKAVNSAAINNWLNLAQGLPNTPAGAILTSGQRAGDLSQLGTLGLAAHNFAGQTNPTVLQPTSGTTTTFGFNFDGLTFVTGNRNSGLGLSVAALGDLNGDGFDDFAIGAPNDSGGGATFVIYGGAALANQPTTGKTIDLEPTAGTINATAPTKVVGFSIPGSAAGTNLGFSVGGLGNYFNTTANARDLGIGVPGMSNNTGAAFAISGAYINSVATGTNVNLSTLFGNNGLSLSLAGIEYPGVNAGDLLGASISSAGSFDGATNSSNQRLDSLLIGAPGANAGGGAAYLVYSVQTHIQNAMLGTIQPLSTLGVAPVTTPVQTFPLQGVVYNDVIPGDRFGFAVAPAGDFNSDGADDIIVGAPAAAATSGGVVLIYGQTGTTTSTVTRINGIFTTSTLAPPTRGASFTGEALGSFAGFSIAPSRHIVFGKATGTIPSVDFLIGSPGLSTGAAYLIPGNTSLTGIHALSTVLAAPINGQKFTALGNSDTAIQVVQGFGTSVSALNPITNSTTRSTSLDSDSIPDLFIGAPFTNFNSPNPTTVGINPAVPSRPFAGVAYALEGALLGGTAGSTPVNPPSNGSSGTSFAATAASILTPPIFTGADAGLASPPIDSLEHLASYAPLPVTIAFQQFRPAPGFLAREEVALHPSLKSGVHQAPRGTILNVGAIRHSENKFTKVNTLPKVVFTRGKFKQGQTITFTHKVKVIPTADQTERLTSA